MSIQAALEKILTNPPVLLRMEELSKSRWLSHQRVYYAAPGDEKEQSWEMIQRTSTLPDRVDGVDVMAILKSKENTSPQIVLIFNYRPPVGKFCLEFPAGLIDGDESCEHAAVRELLEETGLTGRVVHSHAARLFCDPWKSNETSRLVQLEVDLDEAANRCPRQTLDEQERIAVIYVEIKNLFSTIEELLASHGDRVCIDAKLFTWAHGLHAASQWLQ